ncbi:MAG: VPLPA-CTERM sorting domain-containing protein [Hyphococcus sp.]
MMRILGAALAAAAFMAGTASAASLTEIGLGEGDKLFTTEIKRDENVENNGQRGSDVFLRNGEEFAGPNFNVDWNASGTVYDWTIEYDGDQATLTFDGFSPINIDVNPDGVFNAFQLFVRADDPNRLENASTTVTVDMVNGMALDMSLNAIGNEMGAFDKAFTLSDLAAISSISGTIAFAFDVLQGATGSPNSRLAFNFKALSVSEIPVPAALPLLLSGLAGLGFASRRRKAGAA